MSLDTGPIRVELTDAAEHLCSRFPCCSGHRLAEEHMIDLVEEVEENQAEIGRLTADIAAATRLLEYALHLRMYGENAPGGNETWRKFDRDCEQWLRRNDTEDGT